MTCPHCQKETERCTHAALHEEIRVFRALEAARQKIEPSKGVVMVRSLISHRTQKPRIDIQVGEVHTQVDVDGAMDIAKNIIECAEGSYADGFIFNFMCEKVGLDQERAALVIEEFREYREKLAEEFRKLQEEK